MLSKQEYDAAVKQLNRMVCKPGKDGKLYTISGRSPDEVCWTLGFCYREVNGSIRAQAWWDARDDDGNYLRLESEDAMNLNLVSFADQVSDYDCDEDAVRRLLDLTRSCAASHPPATLELNGKRYKLVEISG